jgi:hypothetical protein
MLDWAERICTAGVQTAPKALDQNEAGIVHIVTHEQGQEYFSSFKCVRNGDRNTTRNIYYGFAFLF